MSVKREFLSRDDNIILDVFGDNQIIKNYKFITPNKIMIESATATYISDQQWNSTLIDSLGVNLEKINHDFGLSFAEDYKDKNSTDQSFSSPHYKIDGQFNYNTDYHDQMAGQNEKQLLSFYLLYKNNFNSEYESNFSIDPNKRIEEGLFKNFAYNYLNSYRFQTDDSMKIIENTLFGSDYDHAKNYNRLKDLPIYNELDFSYHDDSVFFKKQLDENNFLEHFVCNVLHHNFQNGIAFTEDQQVVNVRYASLLNIIDNFKNYSSNKIVLTKKNMNNIGKLSFVNKSFLASKVLNMYSHCRNYKEIFNGIKSKKEILFFRVDKYADALIGKPIQSYYVPASKIGNTIKIIDTQIHYDRRYHYVVNAYILTYGTAYSDNIESSYQDEATKTYKTVLSVDTDPNFRIYEIEFFRTSYVNSEIPPNRPSAEFLNTSNSNNKIGIRLEQPLGKTEEKFQIIHELDEEQKDSMKASVTQDDKFKFKNSRTQVSYQIFRITDPPKGYSDFANNMIEEIDTELNKNTIIIRDTILPNKKYYYVFRASSMTDKVSNPSPIYEVELKKDSGESNVIASKYVIPSQRMLKKAVPFKQMLYVTPATEQRYLDIEDERLVNATSYDELYSELMLGNGIDRKVWNRKFKIRLKSTTSGKIIDFNVKFKIKKVRNVEELN
jgi:hypothetical protein